MENIKYYLDYKGIAETLLKKNNIHEGIWGVFVEFKNAAVNIKMEGEVLPSFVIGVNSIGIHRVEQESSISFDAAKLNPAPKSKNKTKAK